MPIAGAAADRDLAPVYPGITDADTLGDWDPPFPIDLQARAARRRGLLEAVPDDAEGVHPVRGGQRAVALALRRSHVGAHSSPAGAAAGERARSLRGARCARRSIRSRWACRCATCAAEGLAASRGSTDFGEYFIYFSFFLVVSALLLAALFFRLGVEQRAREVGLLRAVGFTHARVRRLFAAEGLLLAVVGSVVGIAGAVGYARRDDGRPATGGRARSARPR